MRLRRALRFDFQTALPRVQLRPADRLFASARVNHRNLVSRAVDENYSQIDDDHCAGGDRTSETLPTLRELVISLYVIASGAPCDWPLGQRAASSISRMLLTFPSRRVKSG